MAPEATDSTPAAQPATPASKRHRSSPSIQTAPTSGSSAWRRSWPGEELITDLFEAMHDLHFVRDPHEGADFVLTLALEEFRSEIGMVHLYDINRREFVIARAVGPKAQQVIGGRTAERDPLVTEIMRRRRPFVLDVRRDPRVKAGRWAALGAEPRVILASAVEQAGRSLGVIEIANPAGRGTYDQAEVDGLSYMVEQFAEFVARRGLVFSSDSSRPPP
jgi:GAF domain-containing protein